MAQGSPKNPEPLKYGKLYQDTTKSKCHKKCDNENTLKSAKEKTQDIVLK